MWMDTDKMYILTRSLDGKRIVGDFISTTDLSKYTKNGDCAYFDWKKGEIVYVGKFTKKEKAEIKKRLEIEFL